MSTMLDGQIVTWRTRERSGPRLAAPLLRALAVAAAITSALLYFVTRSQTVEVISALAREAVERETARPVADADAARPDSAAIVVSMRPSALEGGLLRP
jgi:hypothetical protein